DLLRAATEVAWMSRVSTEFELPVSFALLEVRSEPDLWRELMDASARANDRGARLVPQIAVRPFGVLTGFGSNHPSATRPASAWLAARLPFGERSAERRRPELRDATRNEQDLPRSPARLFAALPGALAHMTAITYLLGHVP